MKTKGDYFGIGVFVSMIVFSIIIWTMETFVGMHLKSPKPITPELQITGNGVNMDTVYIYKLDE